MKGRSFSTELIDVAGASRLAIDRAELRVVTGPDRGLDVALGVESLLIGSAPDCQLVLHDSTVSAHHAEVVFTGRGHAIRDLGSKNGIVLDRWPVERAPLSAGMRLRLGNSVLTVRALRSRQEVPLVAAGDFGGLVVRSVRMRATVATLEQLATSDVTVLLEGESGTGKEMAAHALHAAGARARGPFVVFDCASVTASLAAVQLFGHERGAFTGALDTRAGVIEEAEGGTLFLDEIGELPLDLQPLLLRLVDTRTSSRVGSAAEQRHDVRIVAATNRNLSEEVRARRFREDLFFRLSVARVRLPALRERVEDIPVLAGVFARETGAHLTPELLTLLVAYDWPGNVRELRNAIARAAVIADPTAEIVTARLLPPLPEARRLAVDEFERRYVEQALALAGGQLSRAAELAGVSRQMLTRLAAKHGLRGRGRDEG